MNKGYARKGRRIAALLTAVLVCLVTPAAGITACGLGTDTAGETGNAQAEANVSPEPGGQETGGSFFYRDTLTEEALEVYDVFAGAAQESDPGQLNPGQSDPSQPDAARDGSFFLLGEPADIDTALLAYQAFLYDHPEIFWLDRSFRYRKAPSGDSGGYDPDKIDAVGLNFTVSSREEADAMERELEESAEELISRLQADLTEYQTAEAVFDLLIKETSYREEAVYDPALTEEHTAYGALVTKSAVCDGYALGYIYLLRKCGIRCAVVPGRSRSQNHAWAVFCADGKWYEADPAWSALGPDRYFGLTTQEMSEDHERGPEGTELAAPEAVSGHK